MARRFSDEERQSIRKTLMNEGRGLFAAGGMKALSLSTLTRAAGIAKTSFYAFFPSKEVIILEILGAEAPGFSERVMTPLANRNLPARDALAMFLRALLCEYETNPFLARLVAEPETLDAIARRTRPDDLEHKAEWMERPLAAFFAARMEAGEITLRPVGTLIDLVRAISLLALHRNRFEPAERFEVVTGDLIRLVTDGLTRKDTET